MDSYRNDSNDWQSVCARWKRQNKSNSIQVYCLHLHSALELEMGTTSEGGRGRKPYSPCGGKHVPHTELNFSNDSKFRKIQRLKTNNSTLKLITTRNTPFAFLCAILTMVFNK